MKAKNYQELGTISLLIQGGILFVEAMAITLSLLNLKDKNSLGLFFVLHFCLGVWQLGDALIGSITGSKWRQYYLASAICYLSFLITSSYLYNQQHIIDLGRDFSDYFMIVSLFIIPAVMGCFYAVLCYKDMQAKMTIK